MDSVSSNAVMMGSSNQSKMGGVGVGSVGSVGSGVLIPSEYSSFSPCPFKSSVDPSPSSSRRRRGGDVEHPLLLATRDLVQCYHRSSKGTFKFDVQSVPRRTLTHPNVVAGNGGCDNERGDLIMSVGDVLRGGGTQATYVVEDLIGQGTFGQVVRCTRQVPGHVNDQVAVKVVRNKPAYTRQGLIEIGIVEHLNRADPEDKHHVVRMHDYFVCKNHVCLVFELLSVNLYDLLKSNGYRGLSPNLVRVFCAQLLDTCQLVRRNSIIHCDLKPENILLVSATHPLIKVIDFGSACYENHTSFSYIQSRFYRSPEVLLGLPYGMDIDMWSVGCIAAELYLGLPLFSGSSELQQIRYITEALGPMPQHMLLAGSKSRKYFNVDEGLSFTIKSEEQFCAENNCAPKKPSRRYFQFFSLEDLVRRYPSQNAGQPLDETRRALAHFLGGLLQLDPMERWTPQQAARHPFITGEPFDGDWRPSRRAFGLLGSVGDSPIVGSPPSATASPRMLGESPSGTPRMRGRGGTFNNSNNNGGGGGGGGVLPFPQEEEGDDDDHNNNNNNNNNMNDVVVTPIHMPPRSQPVAVPGGGGGAGGHGATQRKSTRQPMLGLTPTDLRKPH